MGLAAEQTYANFVQPPVLVLPHPVEDVLVHVHALPHSQGYSVQSLGVLFVLTTVLCMPCRTRAGWRRDSCTVPLKLSAARRGAMRCYVGLPLHPF